MVLINLKKFKDPVGIKSIWASEEKDMSPYIAEHLDEISEITGIQFGDYELEKRVGRYESDIVVNILNDEDEDALAIIENKLGSFDHDHLGKALTYMSYLNAKCIIWICDCFNEEHIKAVKYLNEMTDSRYSFYAIGVNVYNPDKNKFYEFSVLAEPDYIEKARNVALSEKSMQTAAENKNYLNALRDELNNNLQDAMAISKRGDNCAGFSRRLFTNNEINVGLTKKQVYMHLYDKDDNEDRLKETKEYLEKKLSVTFDLTHTKSRKRDSRPRICVSKSYENDPVETLEWLSHLVNNTYDLLKIYV